MTIRTRLTFWYAIILAVSLVLIGAGTYREIAEQMRAKKTDTSPWHALNEASEMVFQVGLPAIFFGLVGGWILTRRTLTPITNLTAAIKKVHDRNLREPLPRSGNGDELDNLTSVFNDMTARLDDSFQRVREFTLHASHELKTPLTIMHGELEGMLQDPALAAAHRDALLGQLDEVRRLSQIVDGLTLLAKAGAGQIKLNRETLDFDELVRDNFADTQILAEPAKIQVTMATCEKTTVRGDRNRLRQLLLNLADNAVKYNCPHGQVTMNLRRGNGCAQFVITNTGAGIAPELLPRVFDPFFRCDPAHSGPEGSGLGLSIAQWIVSAHQGTIQISSTVSELTTVTVQLPLDSVTELP